jgi:hypothetical protein
MFFTKHKQFQKGKTMNSKSKIIVVLFALLAACVSIDAFPPNYISTIVIPGHHHQKITAEALGEVYAEYGYGNYTAPYTKNMKSAIRSISKANAKVDFDKRSKDAIWHCIGEQLTPCSNLVKDRTEYGVSKILSGSTDDVHDIIGAVTHTLQDFYAHSNWVELYGAVVNDEMGYGPISNVAEPYEDTCEQVDIPLFTSAKDACALMDDNNIITTKLTSAYYKDTIMPPAGVKKCFHGGSFDGLGKDGINKDSSVCSLTISRILNIGIVLSPHNRFHEPAVEAARAATVKYFRNIRDTLLAKQGDTEGDIAFRRFLGFGAAAKFSINVMENATKDEDAPLASKPLFNMRARYSDISTDCPELSGFDIYKTVSSLPAESNLFIYTDASIKDKEMAKSAAILANQKNIKINNALIGQCSLGDLGYFEISDMTGGQVFILNKNEVEKLTELSDIAASDYYVEFANINDHTTSNETKSYDFKVDSKTDRLSVSVSITSGNAEVLLTQPNGSIVETDDLNVKRTVLSSAVIYDIKNPDIGTWEVEISGQSEFTLNSAGSSPLSFDSFKFVEYDVKYGGFYEMDGFPIAKSVSAIEAVLSDVVSDVRFELRSKNGKSLENLTLDAVDKYENIKTVFLKEDFTVPSEEFVVYAFGKDENGAEFQRVLPQKITPKTLSVATLSNKEMPQESDTVYTFRVTNHADNETFNFRAADNQGYIVSVKPSFAVIDKDGFIDVDVTVNPKNDESIAGEKNVLTFLAYGAKDKKSGNYAVVESSIVKKDGSE